MPTKTRAEIPAETAAAQRTHYEPAYPIDMIREHPKNIRHNAVADDELVASIREQGLLQPLVAASDGMTEGVDLIAGHRRLDGLKKAGYTHAPVVIRYDLTDEADQVAAMLVENGRRADLTPIEEAEGFDVLAGLDWTVEHIATATGRSKTLVNDRRKLTRLPETTKTAVDAGQVTIDDALRIAKLPQAAQREAEKYVNKSDFRYELTRLEERAKAAAEVDAQAKALKARGIPEIEFPKSVQNVWSLNHAAHGAVRLASTGKPNASDHNDCLAFARAGTKQYPQIWEVCTDPSKHDDDLTEEQLARKAENAKAEAKREQDRLEREERERAEHFARQLRADTIVAGIKIKPSQIDPTLQALIRLALPGLFVDNPPTYGAIFQDLANVPAEMRWEQYQRIPDAYFEHVAGLEGLALIKTLAAYLVADIEHMVAGATGYMPEPGDVDRVTAYFDALAAAGHERNSVDEQLLAKIADHQDDVDDKAAS